MSFLTNTLNAADDVVKTVDPLSWSVFGKDVSDYRKGPAQTMAPKGPTDADIAAAADLEAQAEQRRLARGRTSTILTGGSGLANMGQTSKVLLGQ